MTFLCCLKKPKQILRFVNYMRKRHKNIKFLFKTEKDNSFSFLMVTICREKDKFTTSAFRKDTFSVVYTNFSSLVALEHKFGLHRSFTIGSDFSKFHFEVETLKKTLHKNAYPTKFVDKCIAKFVNNIFGQKTVFTTVPKLELRIVLKCKMCDLYFYTEILINRDMQTLINTEVFD